jgi:SAM-dependent methyltransferase
LRRNNKHFWNKEYKRPAHLAISTEPSGDLEKFTRWQERNYGREFLNPQTLVADLGCGNGRNLIFLARDFGCRGVGYDISSEAIKQAKTMVNSDLAPLEFSVRPLNETIPLSDNSASIVLDMMSSHILKKAEREKLREEIIRVLKPSGWLFFKSFLLEEDLNARRMIHDYPGPELNSYIHPTLGVYEHVWTIDELEDFFGPYFEIHKIEKSHKHMSHGRAFRRRTVTVYLQKRAY